MYAIVERVGDRERYYDYSMSRESAVWRARQYLGGCEPYEVRETADGDGVAFVGQDWSIEVRPMPRLMEDIAEVLNRRAGRKLVSAEDIEEALRLRLKVMGVSVFEPRVLWHAVADALDLERVYTPAYIYAMTDMRATTLEEAIDDLHWWADAVVALSIARSLGDRDLFDRVDIALGDGDAERARRIAEEAMKQEG